MAKAVAIKKRRYLRFEKPLGGVLLVDPLGSFQVETNDAGSVYLTTPLGGNFIEGTLDEVLDKLGIEG